MSKSSSIPITERSQVGEARREAIKLAIQLGFDIATQSNLAIIVTELGTNLHKHAQNGELILRGLNGGKSTGLEILSVDRGPGMNEVAKCMEDGYSTTGTSGNGLGSVKRISTVFDIYSNSQGTVIVSQIWTMPTGNEYGLQIGAVCLPYPGEQLCGDAWSYILSERSPTITVADGLGHGEHAAQAADQAISTSESNSSLPPHLLLQKMHGGLRPTRGAAVLIVQTEFKTRKLVCAGIGNISSGLLHAGTSKSFVSLNGTVGHEAQRIQEYVYDWPKDSLLFFHSDGLQTRWKLDLYPGLSQHHPSVVAAVLYRDFRRGRDDVTIVIARETS